MKRKTLLVLGLGALMTMTSCQGGGGDGDTYTYRSYVSGTPTNWNPHTWEDSGADEVTAYSEIGFVDFTYDPDVEGGYKIVYEMANAITDVTEDAAIVDSDFKEKWGIEEGDEGRVWKIDLNQNAKFASGKVINAKTYVDSMELLLNSKYKNYRANGYYDSDTSIVHAFNYYNAGATSLTNLGKIPTWGVTVEDKVYLDFPGSSAFSLFGLTYEDMLPDGDYGSYGTYYFSNSAGENLLTKYPEPVELTDEVKADLVDIPLWTDGLELTDPAEIEENALYYCCSSNVTYDDISFSDVGLYALDDYTLIYITELPVSEFNFNVASTSLWLVNPEKYVELTTETGGIKTSSYGTDAAGADGYDSFGPYKLTSFEKDKQFKFTRNENWYGWTDGKHVGQYQTTDIVVDVFKEHASALLAFEKGQLDGVALEQSDLSKYGYSDYIRYVDQTYTMRLVFDSNVDDLKKLETEAGDGKNKQILSEYDFRKAISLSIDRTKFNAEGTAGNKPAYALLNSLYYYDVENDPSSVYRNTDEAKTAIVNLYGIEYGEDKTYKTLDEAYAAVTGYDVEAAKALFESAYEKAVAAGTYTDGQEIKLNIGYYDATTATNTSQTNLLNEFVTKATEGTSLEGKITFEGKSFSGDVSRYDAIGSGQVEISNCAWGGAAFYPFSAMRVYCVNSYVSGGINEQRSFDPARTNLTISFDWGDGKGVSERTMSYEEWSKAIAPGGSLASAALPLKLHVLSNLEEGLLNLYNFAILGSYASVSLDSMKIKMATETYNIMYGFGGLRYMTYNYSDAAWSSFVSSQGGELNYK